MKLPKFVQVHQRFEAPVVEDIGITTEAEVARMIVQAGMSSGASVAVAAGSRGIMHIATIIKHTVDALHNEGMKPFIVPAMGSHGGATSDGQLRVLNNYGISEATMSCPIRSDIEPELIGETGDGLPVYIDRNALSADHIVIVNRIKPHTDFAGDIGSGSMKMMAIGLGKQKGASFYHGSVFVHNFYSQIFAFCEMSILSQLNIYDL